MLINPNEAVSKKWIRKELGFGKDQIQPNSIDLTVKKIEIIEGDVILDDKIKLPLMIELEPIDNFWTLEKEINYSVVFNEYVKIPKNTIGLVWIRSSLNRAGVMIQSGLYDSGFEDFVGANLRTWNPIKIKKDSRIATFIFIEAKSNGLYKGQWKKYEKKKEMKNVNI